jgi:NitT/TauT family transport system permease protein
MSTLGTSAEAREELVAAEAMEDYPLAVTGQKRLSRRTIFLYRLGGSLLALGLWEFIVKAGIVNRLFVPTPLAVWHSLVNLADNGLMGHVEETFKSALEGYALGCGVGILAGVTLGVLPRVNEVVAPFITVMNSMPRIAMAPLFVLWFGIGSQSHVALVFSLVVFIVLTNAVAGTQSVDREFIVLAQLLDASRITIIRKIVIPTVIPWIFAAMRLAWAYALSGAVVGEMFLGQKGLGYLIQAGSGVFNISQIFAALAVTVAIAWLFDNLLRFAERWILRWRPQAGL